MISFRCLICGFVAGSFKEAHGHIIRHGRPVVAAFIGRPDLAERASWGRVLRRAVDAMVRRGMSHG